MRFKKFDPTCQEGLFRFRITVGNGYDSIITMSKQRHLNLKSSLNPPNIVYPWWHDANAGLRLFRDLR